MNSAIARHRSYSVDTQRTVDIYPDIEAIALRTTSLTPRFVFDRPNVSKIRLLPKANNPKATTAPS